MDENELSNVIKDPSIKVHKIPENVCCEYLKQNKCVRKGSKRRSIFITEEKPARTHSAKMIEKIGTEEGRQMEMASEFPANIFYANGNRGTCLCK